MELLGLSKESEVGRVMAEFDEKEDADEICDAGNTSTKEEVYAGENAHIKSKTEKDMKRFTDTFKSEIDKQTQTTQVLMATLLTEIEHRTSPQQQSQQQSTDPTDSTSLLKGKLAELEAALYKSLREQMRAKKEVKRLKRVFQALNSEKARLVTARERLEAEVSSLRAPSQVTLTISDSTLSSAGSLSQGSLTALSSTPEPDMRRTGKDAQLTAISTSPALTYSGDQASDTPVPMPSSSSSSSLSSITSLVTSSGIAQQQLRALKDIHEADERKIRELSEQCEKYSHDVIRLELRAKNPDEETVRKHPHTVCLNDRLASLSEVNQSLSELNKSCSVQCGMVARQVRDLGQEKLRLTQALRAAQLSLAAAEKRAAKAEDDARKQRELDAAGTVAAAAAAAPDPALKNESEFLAKKTAEIEDTLVRINKDLAAKTEAFNERLCALVEKGTSIKEVESELKKTIGDLKEQVSQLLEEVVNVGSGFEALQAQNSSLTKQLSERDNARINVLREKNKLQTALDHAKKDFEAHKAELATLNDEVKSLREQIALKDNDFQDLQMKYVNKEIINNK